jgi:hypothetical protein
MERKVWDCNDCSRTGLTEIGHIAVAVDRYMDAAGSMGIDYKSADLCPDCLLKHLKKFLKDLSYEGGAKWIKNLKNHK